MRFQQLNRDPNTVMRKKLVKSKKNWVVVSSLSIAGGLFLLGAPSYVAKAATTTDAVQQQEVVTPTPSDSGTTSAPVTDGSTDTSSPDNGATGSATDGTKETVKSDSTDTNTPINGTDDKSTTPGSTTNGVNTGDDGIETTSGDVNTQNQPQAFSAESTPVVEDTSANTNSGNGWSYDPDTKTLTINGQLDEGNGSYQEDRWGRNTTNITTINVETGAAAPVDSSYLFANMVNLTSINNLTNLVFSSVEGKYVTNTEGMFKNDAKLTKIDLSAAYLRKITNISHMFENDESLSSLQLPESNYRENTFKSIVYAQYALANCISLDNIDNIGGWQATDALDFRGMFKNYALIKVLVLNNLHWGGTAQAPIKTETGDSSIGEGMFDGTDLTTIRLQSNSYFNPKTALTSNSGTTWTATSTDKTITHTFSGIPTFDDNGNATGGIGSLYVGPTNPVSGTTNNVGNLIYSASGKLTDADKGKTIPNLITINTIHNGVQEKISFTASGVYGNGPVMVDIPQTHTFEDSTTPYTTSTKQVSVTFGNTQATAVDTETNPVVYSLGPAKSGNVSVKTSNGTSINIPVTADDTDTVTGTKTVSVTNDQIKKLVPGYHLANDAESTDVDVTFISPTTDNPDITGTSTSTIELVGDTTPENDKGSVYTQQGANNVSVPITIPAGTVGTPSDPIKITVDGYEPAYVIATTDGSGNVTYTTNDSTKTVIDADHPLVLTGDPVAADQEVKVPSSLGEQTINIKGGKVGDSETIQLPKQDGYSAPFVNVTYGPNNTFTVTDSDGKTVDDSNSATYVGDPVAAGQEVKVPSSLGEQTVNIKGGKVGDSETIQLPKQDGYSAPSVKVTYGPNNTFTITDADGKTVDDSNTATYVGDPVAAGQEVKVPSSLGEQTVNIKGGKVGDSETIQLPKQDGYSAPSVKVTYGPNNTFTITDSDGKTVDDSNTATYVGDPVAADQEVKVPSSLGEQTVNIKGGKVGDSETIQLPKQDGYSAPSVKVTYGPNNTFTVTDSDGKTVDDSNTATYVGDPVAADQEVKVPSSLGEQTIKIKGGKVGDSETIQLPKQDGYSSPSVTVTYGPNNTFTVTDTNGKTIDDSNEPTYIGDPVAAGQEVKVPSSLGEQTVKIKGGKVGDSEEVTLPHQDGYTAPKAIITYGPNDTFTVTNTDESAISDSNKPTYTGDPVESRKISIPAIAGQKDNTKEVTIKGGKVGDTEDITLNEESGYTSPIVTVTYGPNNTFTVVDKATGNPITKEAPAKYIGTPNKATTITFTKPDGTTQVIDIPEGAGNYGDAPITYTADSVNGYTSPSVIVTYTIGGVPTISYASNPNKTVLSTDKLTYTPIPTNSGNTDNQENSDIEYKNQTISTYADKPAVELYQLGQDGKMTLVTNRSLATATDWQSDAVITIDGVGYYRVSTNEWAKMSQAYPYTAPNVYVRAYSDSAKPLYKAESDLIKNRSLAANSSWIADHQTYVINGTKHYRVSTNEFVDEKDVYEYTPVNEIVTTHSGSSDRLYTAKGDLVSNRSLSAHSSWKTDSITTINGEQYYRVSTNEFVKAADVDVNH